jgi:transcriptional regulator with XRE-family HTH domain
MPRSKRRIGNDYSDTAIGGVYEKEDLLVFAEALKEKRTEKEYTQRELAEKVGISRQYMCNLEKGDYFPGILTLMRFAEVLKVDFKIGKKGITIPKNVKSR